MKHTLKLVRAFAASLITVCPLSGGANAAVIAGPTMTDTTSGHTSAGIIFTALINTTLESFLYNNINTADTIQLQSGDGTSVLQAISSPAGTGSHLVNVNWNLTSGNHYRLVGIFSGSDGGRFAAATFPQSNSEISVIAGVFTDFTDTSLSNYWGAFNNITTNSIPEPSSALLLGLGAVGLVARRRRNS